MAKRCMGCMKTYGDEFEVCPYCGYVEGTPPKEAYHMKPGTVLHGKYIVGKVVGYGGFGVTYAAWDKVLRQKVAIKEYLPSEFATRVPGEETITVYSGEKETQFAIGRDKFSDEAKRLARFNSVEGVVEIKDTFHDNDTAYIVMEFLEGETLKERINREGKIPPEEAVEITKSVLATLEQVHKDGIIHRDIAPDNIFLCSDGRIKLLDFGASRYATVQHSKSLSIILKEGYAPEEQYRSKGEQGSWSDIYAVGATLYKMLTGVTPEDAMERAENDKLKPVSKYGVKLTKEVETALMNSLNVFAEDRTQTAEEFMTELTSDAVTRKERTRKKIDLGKWPLWSKIAVGCVAIALAATGFVLADKSSYALAEGQTYVPEVINMTDEKAEKTIEKSELTSKIIGQEKSDRVDMGRVMTQYPAAGRVVNVGELVELKISAGNEVQMADLTGMDKEEAESLLLSMGFTDVEFIEEESGAEKGTVTVQDIEAGKTAKAGEKITITISKGVGKVDKNKDVSVPSLTGMSYEEAAKKAGDVKLYVSKGKSEYSDKPEGTVLKQSLKAGSTTKEGTTIELTVSAGKKSDKVEVPYVEYMSESDAKTLLAAYGLKSKVSYKDSDTVGAGLVMKQSKEAGKKVEPGSTIELTVSKGAEKVSVPNVKGMSESDAIAALRKSGFRYASVYKMSESVGKGKVMSYEPADKQEKGAKITLTVSEGDGKEAVPDITGMKQSSAIKALEDKGFTYTVLLAKSESVAEDKVISYSPGGRQKKGTKITVTVSSGSGKANVPNVNGKNYKTAIDELTGAGFNYTVKYANSESVDWGKVISYSPSGKQEKGSRITMTVSKGTAGKLVSESEYKSTYSDSSKYAADKRYRYATRSLQSITDGYPTNSTYNVRTEKSSYGSTSYGNWIFEEPTASTTPGSRYQTVVTVQRERGYKSFAFYNEGKTYCKEFEKGDYTHLLKVWSSKNIKNVGYELRPDGSYRLDSKTLTIDRDGTAGRLGTIFVYRYDGEDITTFTVKGKLLAVYLWPTGRDEYQNGTYLYRTVTNRYQYTHYGWSSWSSWSDWTTKQQTSDTKKEDSEVRYYVTGKEPN